MVPKITDILHFVLLPYTEDGSALLKTNYHSIHMILRGEFNVNFSLPEVEALIAVLTDEQKLEMNTNRNISTPNSDTVIDAVFQRFLNTLKSQVSTVLYSCLALSINLSTNPFCSQTNVFRKIGNRQIYSFTSREVGGKE
ncbi:hypothetical protein TNCV_2231381 [Trichonephila clavipes]|nr:hypothetical protein TNCV_2231381 [Trichonephila clavipes]